MRIKLALAVVAIASAAPVSAGGTLQNGYTVGDCISDGFYGNEPNPTGVLSGTNLGPSQLEPGTKGGTILPSASPGPKVYNGGTPIAGPSVGDVNQLLGGGYLNEKCWLLTNL